MKLKEGFLLRDIAGSWVVVPVGQRVIEFNGLMNLSESGALLWKKLEEGINNQQELTDLLVEQYEVDTDMADSDVIEFLDKISERGLIEQCV